MKKPVWIRVVGWVALGLFAVGLAGCVNAMVTSSRSLLFAQVAVAVFLWVPAFGLWALATVIHKLMVNNARVKAEAMGQIVTHDQWVAVQPPAVEKKDAPPKFRSGPLGL